MSSPRAIYVVLCNLFFIFSLIFIVINHIASSKQMYLFFVQFLEYLLLFEDENVDEESQYFFEIAKVQPQGVT